MSLKSEELVALGCVVREKVLKEAKDNLGAGTYNVDLLVRVKGYFDKGEDFEMKAAAKVDWKLLASLALSKLNNETQDVVIDAFIAALDQGEAEKDALIGKVKDRVEGKIEIVKGAAPTVTAHGRVTATLIPEIVGQPSIDFKPKA
jgi:hypothetical protein